MIDDNLKELAQKLFDCYEEMYNLCYPEVERIIIYQITDVSLIEHTLDRVLDIYTEKGFNLFLKLLFYYSTIDLEKTYAYIDILKETRKDEYNEYVKKLKK